MTLEEVIVAKLKNYAPLTALIGARVYPDTYPQGSALPVVTYQEVSDVPEYTHDGPAGYEESLYDISSFALTHVQAKQTAKAVEDAFRSWMTQQDVVSGVHIGNVERVNRISVSNIEDTEQLSTRQVLSQYRFIYGEGD